MCSLPLAGRQHAAHAASYAARYLHPHRSLSMPLAARPRPARCWPQPLPHPACLAPTLRPAWAPRYACGHGLRVPADSQWQCAGPMEVRTRPFRCRRPALCAATVNLVNGCQHVAPVRVDFAECPNQLLIPSIITPNDDQPSWCRGWPPGCGTWRYTTAEVASCKTIPPTSAVTEPARGCQPVPTTTV
jgi:hypothetical protein